MVVIQDWYAGRCGRTALLMFAFMVIDSDTTAQCDPLELQELAASDAAAGDEFGTAVATDGEFIVVGAFREEAVRGAVYVYEMSGGSWEETQRITASVRAANDAFGAAVAMEGEFLFVGAPGDGPPNAKGAVYVFQWNGSTWDETQILTASDGVGNDRFGVSVSADGTAVVIGAYGDDSFKGAAYAFRNTGGNWAEEDKLTASDGAASYGFGAAVSLSGDFLIVGAPDVDASSPGAAYAFEHKAGDWDELQKLPAAGLQNGDQFGNAISLRNDWVIVGALSDNGARGSAQIFQRTGLMGDHEDTITASDAAAGDSFGSAVAMGDDLVVVGAYAEANEKGSAYVFYRDGSNWREDVKFTPGDNGTDRFGVAIVLHEMMAVIGAPFDDEDGANSGSAYVFDLNCGEFAPLESFTVKDGTLLSGTIARLEQSDNQRMKVASEFLGGDPAYRMTLEITLDSTVVDPELLDVLVESKITENGGTAKIYLRNWTLGKWVRVKRYGIGTEEQIKEILGLDAADYIKANGEIKVRIRHESPTALLGGGFDSEIDHVQVTVR